MLELWQFIFSSFWVWLGTLILIASVCGTITGVLAVCLMDSKKP